MILNCSRVRIIVPSLAMFNLNVSFFQFALDYAVDNAYMDEKEEAIRSLKLLAEHTG